MYGGVNARGAGGRTTGIKSMWQLEHISIMASARVEELRCRTDGNNVLRLEVPFFANGIIFVTKIKNFSHI